MLLRPLMQNLQKIKKPDGCMAVLLLSVPNLIRNIGSWPGQWEEWHEQLNAGIVSYRGNNGKWANRRANDDLWEEASNSNSNDAKFDFIPIGGSSTVFRLRNKGNNKFVVHNNGNSCTEADVTNPGSEAVFRYVAY